MSSGLCVDCELKGAIYRVSRQAFDRAVLVERGRRRTVTTNVTNNTHTLSPSRGEDAGQRSVVGNIVPPEKGWIAWRQVKRE